MRTRWWIAAVLAVALVGVGLALRRKPVPSAPAQHTTAAPVVSGDVTLQGKIRPQHVVGVAASVEGFVEAFLVEPGQDVYEGQVLARIGAQSLESNREAAATALERAQEQVTRAEAALSGARMELSRAEADSTRSRLNLERIEKIFSRQQTLYR